ncbi:MAG: hypothetical protein IBX64_09990 [Actinobacteria bacterium]|nr:hypothetical protein [Actinomycetota bacterium]
MDQLSSDRRPTRYKSLKKLGLVHHKAMALRATGLVYDDIAVSVNRSPATVRNWFQKDELFKATWKNYGKRGAKEAARVIREYAPREARRIIELMRKESKPRGPLDLVALLKELEEEAAQG